MIYVCPLSQLAQNVVDLRPSHLITLLGSEHMDRVPPMPGEHAHLKLTVNDISAPRDGLIAPGTAHIEQILRFVDEWDRSAPMLIHCWAGISRSTATAYIALCHLNHGQEAAAARLLRERARHAQPNKGLVALADQLMEREGRMIAAIDEMGPGEFEFEGSLFSISPTL